MSVVTPTFTRDPQFGRDPWQGPQEPHLELAADAPRIYAGADTIGGDLNLLPRGLALYGSYVDNFGGFPELVNLFGKSAFLVSFTIFGNPALCADVESGAMVNAGLPHWLDHVAWKDVEGYSWVYTSAGNLAAVNNAIGGRKVKRFSAHYGQGPHICGPQTCGYPQADWTQWDDKGAQGQNIDRSIGTYLPVPPSPPKPPAWTWEQAFRVGFQRGFNVAWLESRGETVPPFTVRVPLRLRNAFNDGFQAGFKAGW